MNMYLLVEPSHRLRIFLLLEGGSAGIAVKWFEARVAAAIEELNDDFSKYRISEALMVVYKLFRDEF